MAIKKLILYILIPFFLFFASTSSARNAAILIDASNGKVLFEQDASHAWYPASLTKLMTLYMTFDALREGHIQLQDVLIASYHVSRQPNSKLGLKIGQSLTVEEAILAVITRSANDAAVVLAEYIGGSESSFAAQMTTKAHSIGMIDSHFMNATGLPDDLQVSTAKDMAILAWRAQRDFPEYYPYFATHSFVYNGQELLGINKFTANYPGAEGMKTGFTCGSGFNLIASATQNDKHLIGVILGGMTSAERYQLMIDMMDEGFASQEDSNSLQSILTIPAMTEDAPPYVLNCGKGAIKQVINHDVDEPVHVVRKVINNRKNLGKSKHKLISRNIVIKKKPVSKAKVSQRVSVIKKTKVANKSISNSKTRYRRVNQH